MKRKIQEIAANKADLASKIEKWREVDNKMITFTFKNYEHPGQPHEFQLRKYVGENIETKIFMDNMEYTCELKWVNHIKSCCNTEYEEIKSGVVQMMGPQYSSDGRKMDSGPMKIARKRKRFDAIPREYCPDIIEPEELYKIDVKQGIPQETVAIQRIG